MVREFMSRREYNRENVLRSGIDSTDDTLSSQMLSIRTDVGSTFRRGESERERETERALFGVSELHYAKQHKTPRVRSRFVGCPDNDTSIFSSPSYRFSAWPLRILTSPRHFRDNYAGAACKIQRTLGHARARRNDPSFQKHSRC